MLDKDAMTKKYGFYNPDFFLEEMYTADIHYPCYICGSHECDGKGKCNKAGSKVLRRSDGK